MDVLKLVFTTLLALISFSYADVAGDIILEFDASLNKQVEVLVQLIKKDHLSRYKCGIWFNAKKTMIL